MTELTEAGRFIALVWTISSSGAPAPRSAVAVEFPGARAGATGGRVEFLVGGAERLPFGRGQFDLVLSTTSFDHWHDQAEGPKAGFLVDRYHRVQP